MAGSPPSRPNSLTPMGGVIYFAATGDSGGELWRSDGSAAGTTLVKDINPGPDGSNPSGLVDINGTLLFGAYNGANGQELWKSDGTVVDTVLVQDIAAGAANSDPYDFKVVGTRLFFTAWTASSGRELWVVPASLDYRSICRC
jgi:ELWxxDGT repeat protein